MGSINISQMAKSIISRYDFNNNGVIDLKNPTKGDETTRLEIQQSANAIDYFTWDHRKLFEKADANNDGQVTQDELETVLKTFDKNGDGELQTRTWVWNPRTEYDDYDDAPGEDLVSHVHVPIGPPNPSPYPIPPH